MMGGHYNGRRKFSKLSTIAVSLSLLVSFLMNRNIINLHWQLDMSHKERSLDYGYPTAMRQKPNGVFVFKVPSTEKLEKTLCTLTNFFNGEAQYPIRIFTDHLSESDETIRNFAGAADVKIILNERWKELPRSLTTEQRSKVLEQCSDFDDHERARCTSLKKSLGYIFNTYWTYMEMADEPELSQFDYFVLFDNDAFLTKPMPDPFEILDRNNLVGIYNIESMEAGPLTAGIQEAAEASFTLDERRNAYLDSPSFPIFDDKGVWGGDDHRKPGVWMCMFGGRLDFLRSPRFKQFAKQIPFYSYTRRTSRQSVIPIGWSALAGGDRVWYLPKRGITMGVYHHGWVDDAEIFFRDNDRTKYEKHTLSTWKNFTESNLRALATWKEYLYATDDSLTSGKDWRQCTGAKGSKYGS